MRKVFAGFLNVEKVSLKTYKERKMAKINQLPPNQQELGQASD